MNIPKNNSYTKRRTERPDRLARCIGQRDTNRGHTESATQGTASVGRRRAKPCGRGRVPGCRRGRQERTGPVTGSSRDAPKTSTRSRTSRGSAPGSSGGTGVRAASNTFPQDHEEPQAKRSTKGQRQDRDVDMNELAE